MSESRPALSPCNTNLSGENAGRQPRVEWVDCDAGLRVVVGPQGPVVEAIARLDAMGQPVWRAVDTADPAETRQRKLIGWKAMTTHAGLEPSQWRMVFKASRRNIDPLLVFYNAWDEPFTYEVVMRDWLARQVRPARAFDLERLAERARRRVPQRAPRAGRERAP